MSSGPTYINEDEVKKILTWPLIFESVEQSLLSVSNHGNRNFPNAVQNPRSFTSMPDGTGVLLSMPGFIGNYNLPSVSEHKYNTLACKLVTSFKNNERRQPPLPNILASIFLFNNLTGKLNGIVEGTQITESRTAGASIVATKTLYFNRLNGAEKVTPKILAIVGCGTQGRIHSIGMIETFTQFNEIRLWNRTIAKAENLRDELLLKYRNIRVIVCESVAQCCANADVVVTATNSGVPLVYSTMLKPNCHINAVGAGIHHYSEISTELYGKCKVYVDSLATSKVELKGLDEFAIIVGQVGDVISELLPIPTEGVTVFQSLGMAVEDAAVAQMVYEKYLLNKNKPRN